MIYMKSFLKILEAHSELHFALCLILAFPDQLSPAIFQTIPRCWWETDSRANQKANLDSYYHTKDLALGEDVYTDDDHITN